MNLESTEYYGSWSGAKITKFLEHARMPLRVSLHTKNGLLIVPIWSEFRAGRFFSCSPNDSWLVKSLRENPQVAFDLSTNEIPYRGLRGRGIARCSNIPDKHALENLLKRFTGGTANTLAESLLGRVNEEAIIDIDITWLTSWDFSKRMDRIEKIATRLPGAPI
jgi:hypothetical protein